MKLPEGFTKEDERTLHMLVIKAGLFFGAALVLGAFCGLMAILLAITAISHITGAN